MGHVVLGVLLVCGVIFAQAPSGSTSLPASSPAGVPATLPAEASVETLRRQAIVKALEGRFSEALTELEALARQQGEDPRTRRAISLLRAYMQRKAQAEAERKREYEYEVDRIRWACLAQKHMPELESKPFLKPFRDLIKKQLTQAYQAIGTAEGLESASAKEAAKMKQTSLENIDQARQQVRQALELLKDRQGPYADEFRREANVLLTILQDCQERWAKVDPATPKTRWRGARTLQDVEDRLADAVTDLEVLAAKRPWTLALLHGRIAQKLAPDPEVLAQTKWYRELIRDTQQRGRQAVQDAKWYDALSAYSSLQELEPDNETYRQEGDTVSRHVRVLRLYGDPKEQDDELLEETLLEETDDEEIEEEDDGPVWKDVVAGVDADMVRKAISKIGHSYVKDVDYRKLTRGAIQSILVLAQTPQVRETFPGLKDTAQREAFIAALRKELDDIEKPDCVRPLDLMRALNNVLDASEETVNLPVDVLAVEFADGFLNELDKFSNMIWPSDVTNFNKSTMGQFTGIGVQISKERGEPLKVITPLLGTPAIQAGIKAGDLILEVDGKDTRKRTIDKLIKLIMGPPNTTVTLTIQRRGVEKPFPAPVVRQPVHIRTVKGWQRRDDGEWSYQLLGKGDIGYVRLTQFTDTTHESLQTALRQLQEAGIRSLILDLRSNPGGLLRSATKVADEFLSQGDIVSTRGRQVPRSYKRAHDRGLYLRGNLVVLLDQHSASAAEILSGALKDLNRAIIVGRRSYGKGSVQNVIPVRENEAFLKLTTAYYYLPSNRLLHRQNGAEDWGVNPDVEVYITPRQMRRWVQIRQKTDLLQEFDPELLQADLTRQYDSDLQLDTAVLLLELLRLQEQPTTVPEHFAVGP